MDVERREQWPKPVHVLFVGGEPPPERVLAHLWFFARWGQR